jgi:hypothetical protein
MRPAKAFTPSGQGAVFCCRGLAQEADSAVWLANLRQTRHQRVFQNGRD